MRIYRTVRLNLMPWLAERVHVATSHHLLPKKHPVDNSVSLVVERRKHRVMQVPCILAGRLLAQRMSARCLRRNQAPRIVEKYAAESADWLAAEAGMLYNPLGGLSVHRERAVYIKRRPIALCVTLAYMKFAA
jgi:hypothetical protein